MGALTNLRFNPLHQAGSRFGTIERHGVSLRRCDIKSGSGTRPAGSARRLLHDICYRWLGRMQGARGNSPR
jgi:hypothetical protein